MIINVVADLSEPVALIVQRSKRYQHQSSEPLTLDQLLSICNFAHFYENEARLNFIQNEGDILYGFCYGEKYGHSYWMFLDEQLIFYDVQLPYGGGLSKKTKAELGDIWPTVELHCCSPPTPRAPPTTTGRGVSSSFYTAFLDTIGIRFGSK